MDDFTELDRLSDEDIRTLMHGVRALNATPTGKKLIARSIADIRAGKFKTNQPRDITLKTFSGYEDLQNFLGSDEPQENQ